MGLINKIKDELKAKGYKYSVTSQERKDLLNQSINRRMAKRFANTSSVDRFFLTTLFY